MKKKDLIPESYHFTLAIDAVAKYADPKDAVKIVDTLLEDMIIKNRRPNMLAYDAALTASIRAADTKMASHLIEKMKKNGIKPDIRFYNNLMKVYVSKAKIKNTILDTSVNMEPKVPEIIKKMLSENIVPDKYSFIFAITEIGLLKGAAAATKFLADSASGKFGESSNSALNIQVFNSVFEVLSREGQVDQAVNLMRQAKAAGIEPNVYSYTICLNGCAYIGPAKWELCQKLLSEVEKAGTLNFSTVKKDSGRIPSNEITRYNDMLSPNSYIYCAAAGCIPSWKEAAPFLLRMRVNGVNNSSHVLCSLLAAIRRSIKWSGPQDSEEDRVILDMEALKNEQLVFDKMKELLLNDYKESADRSPEPWNVVLRVCATRGDMVTALNLFEEMEKRGVRHDAISYNAVVCSCARNGSAFRDALGFIEEMKKKGFEPEETTLISLLDSCAFIGTTECANIALKMLEVEKRILFTPRAIRSVIKACGNAGDLSNAIKLYEMAKNADFGNEVVNAAIIACDRCGDLKKAKDIIADFGSKAQPTFYTSYLEGCVHNREAEESLNFIKTIPKKLLRVGHYNAVFHAIAVAKDGAKIEGEPMRLFNEMQEKGYEPMQSTYLSVLKALKRTGEWKDAFDLIAEMRGKNVPMQNGFYSAAIAACANMQ
eukprot:CAMPEP_0171462098 /NCGR_PEP_ID=MMETSP0945-20130129/6277_1 /TAXON_ID=109269 /ORGANISM="Vaucheria litorea, Strain CCMP2940" /LENGTH=654 /DNA_ID=CAMNT_0011988567 /DNA_START=637 /DNA_END=2598 /DNA_ORIENTATION=+